MSHLYMKRLMLRASLGLAVTLGAGAAGGESVEPALEYAPYVLAHSEGLPNGLTGRLKANGRSTRGNYSVVVRESQTSQAADAHTHSQLVEAWYVVDGGMTFLSRGSVIDAPAGTFVLVPPAVEHGFKTIPGNRVRLVQIYSPPGFENLFSERLKLPSYDPGKEVSQQSPQWKADQREIARKYGAGPADQVSSGAPVVRGPIRGSGRRMLATADDTMGRYTLEEVALAPRTAAEAPAVGPGEDQSWYLLSGELHLHLKSADGWDKKVLKIGDFVFVPRGTAFKVANPAGQSARYLWWHSIPRDTKSH